MHLIDRIVVLGSLFIVLAAGLYPQRYLRSVADFLSAGRIARRYLLAVPVEGPQRPMLRDW